MNRLPTNLKSVRTAVILASLSFSLSAQAQKFQEPTKEELQMNSDPKAPGAPAVFLYREEVTDNYSHYVSGYARIKVLTEQGKEWAQVEFPYDPGESALPILLARTIHSDGTVIPLAGKVTDLLTYKTNREHFKVALFTMPSVEVGSILEYRWTVPLTQGKLNFPVSDEETPLFSSWVAREIPTWKVQQEIFVHKEHFYYNPRGPLDPVIHPIDPTDINGLVDGERSTFLFNTQHLPPGKQFTFTPKGDYVFDIQDVPPIPHPFASPAEGTMAYRVIFFYSPYPTVESYWQEEIKRWSRILDRAANATDPVKSAVNQIVSGSDASEVKARKLYDAVQGLDNTDFKPGKAEGDGPPLTLLATVQKKAENVWRARGGSSNDLALLYLALARGAGLEAYGVQVADRSIRSFDSSYLSLRQLDALLVLVRIDGKDIFLDPGEKLCPFGQLHWSHMMAGGLQQNAKAPVFTPANLSADGITAHSADLTLDDNGAVTGTIKILMNGPEALRWRQLNLIAGTADVQKEFSESLGSPLPSGVIGTIDHFEGLDSSSHSLLAVAKVFGPLGKIAGKRIELPAFFFSNAGSTPFVSETTRDVPIDLHYAEQVIDDVVYHLPAGFTVESAPRPTQLPWPSHAALVIKSTPSTGTIDIKHIFARAFVLLDAKEYPALRDFYQKIAAIEQQQLVLAPGATPAGN
jgi:transglutaminase-like putative cysteine protease